MAESALLVLEDGTLFKGESIGISGQAVGEVVFNTAMTGYQEILSDPSYARQIVTLTYPHIGKAPRSKIWNPRRCLLPDWLFGICPYAQATGATRPTFLHF